MITWYDLPVQEAVGCRRECRSSHLWKEQPPPTKEEEEPGELRSAVVPEAPFDRLMDQWELSYKGGCIVCVLQFNHLIMIHNFYI